jgi:hypothetical protein
VLLYEKGSIDADMKIRKGALTYAGLGAAMPGGWSFSQVVLRFGMALVAVT